MISRAVDWINGFVSGFRACCQPESVQPVTPATPARRYRERLRRLSYLHYTVDYDSTLTSDENLRRWVKELHASWNEKPENDAPFFVASVGLLAFGQLDAYRDVLDRRKPRFSLADDGRGSSTLETIAADIFPLPFGLKQAGIDDEEADKIIEWVEANKHKLSWSEIEGRFVLASADDSQQSDENTIP